MTAQSAFWLEPKLVIEFTAGRLAAEGQAVLAGQVARLTPFHTQLPAPLTVRLAEVRDHLGGDVTGWLAEFPGLPRKTARLLRFVELLDRISGEPAVVTALRELRGRTAFPPELRRYLAPDVTAATVGSIGWHIESLLAQDQVDGALRLALSTAAMLGGLSTRVAGLDPGLTDLGQRAEQARQDILDVATRDRLFQDRRDAGRALGALLAHYRGRNDVLVLGLPRGGLPVAYEVATALGAQLDILLVRTLGLPQRPEVAMGAVASGGVVTVNDDVVRGFGISPGIVREAAEEQARELARRERVYRGGAPLPQLSGRTVIVVDDGRATGVGLRAAIQAVRAQHPARLVVAVPAAPQSTCVELTLEADEAVCATTPSPFFAVGASYWDFTRTTDEEVHDLLRRARKQPSRRKPDEVAPIRSAALPVTDGVPSDETLSELVGDARLVLLGAAAQGTLEFGAARARLTRRLIETMGFRGVAVEADWPDAYRVNRYVRGCGDDPTAEAALRGFERFPAWPWRNTDTVEFITWLSAHNSRADDQTGFYGLDLYRMHKSANAVIGTLRVVDPAAAARARERYSTFDHTGGDGRHHGRAAFGAGEPCERAVLEQLADLQRHAMQQARQDGLLPEDELFYAQQNVRLLLGAERYYRAMFGRRESAWNLRERHLADTVDALAGHVGKLVVWAGNSHVGDARATELSARGDHTLGQILRERHPGECRLIGFTTYGGTVTASAGWDMPAERKDLRPAIPGSIEELFHAVGRKQFLVTGNSDILTRARLGRTIGVVYRPDTERRSHYLRARIANQFDAVIHIDETTAAEPLERTALQDTGELPEGYPNAV
jgi:erythromycin esterase-like protein/predicted phosphoribosyltransferase